MSTDPAPPVDPAVFWTGFATSTLSTIATGLAPLAGPFAGLVIAGAKLVELAPRLVALKNPSVEQKAKIAAEAEMALAEAQAVFLAWKGEQVKSDATFIEELRKAAREAASRP